MDEIRGLDQTRIRASSCFEKANTEAINMLSPRTRAQSNIPATLEKSQSRIESAKQSYSGFIANTGKLLSDGIVNENGPVFMSTRRRATLACVREIEAASRAAEKKAQYSGRKLDKLVEREQLVIVRAIGILQNPRQRREE